MTIPARSKGPFSLGKVIQRSFGVIGANLGVFLLLALIFVGLPQSITAGILNANKLDVFAGRTISGIVGGLLAIMLQGAVITGSLAHFRGRPVRLGRCLTAGARYFGGLFVIRLLVGFGVIFGLILLVVPGLIWIAAWSVACVVLVAENGDGAISRSMTLTKGRRWPIFALLVVSYLAYLMLSYAAGFFGATLFRPLQAQFLPNWTVVEMVRVVITPVIVMIYEIFAAAGATAIYLELIAATDGVSADALASVFD